MPILYDPFQDELNGLPYESSEAFGTAAATLPGVTATVSGVRTVLGAAQALGLTLTATVSGVRSVAGTAAATLVLTATASGEPVLFGVAVAPLGSIIATAAGDVLTFVPGLAVAPLGTITATVDGDRTVFGTAGSTLALIATVSGVVTVSGAAVAPLGTIHATAVGTSPVSGVAAAPLGTIHATVVGHSLSVYGVLVAPLGTIHAHVHGVAPIPYVPPEPYVHPPVVSNTLGCGNYEVYFKTRGGDTFVCRARNITKLTYERVLNDVSTATIELALTGQDGNCEECVGSINSWEHEIAIYRDGEEVWCGPVVNGDIDLDAMTASFECKDLFAWADYRWIELIDEDYDVEDIELAEVWNWVLTHGYNKEPWNMDWTVGVTGIPLTTKFYPCYQDPDRWGGTYPNVGDELRTLSKSGIDFTVIRRTLIGGDLEINPPTSLPTLRDGHWAKLPKLSMIGASMATEVGVAGGGGGYNGWDDDQMWIERQNDTYRQRFGLLQKMVNEPTLDDEDTTNLPNAITQEAYGLRELKKQPFVYVKGGELASNAPVDFDTLIPGSKVNLALTETVKQIQFEYRLVSVRVSYDGKNESVSLELTPKGVEALRT